MRCLQASHSRLWMVLVGSLAGVALVWRCAFAQQGPAERQGRADGQGVATGIQERVSDGPALDQVTGAVGVAGSSSDQRAAANVVGAAANVENGPQPQAERAASAASDAAAVAARVDELLAEEVFAHLSPGEQLAPIAGDQVFLRRAALDLIGENPTPEEVISFSLDTSPDKRARVVEEFLAEPRFGRNWARYWRDTIFYRRASDRAIVTAPATEEFLTEKFNQNVGWDLIAREFIVATGSVRENGQTAIFSAQGGMTEDITAEISRIFMGIQIQCAQCHDHPTDRWKREQFHELAAFFPRVALRPERPGDIRSFAVLSDDRFFPRRRMDEARFGQPEHYMPDLNDPESRGTLMTPTFFVTGQKLQLGATDMERRQTLAAWMASPQNPWFARAFVNRVWGELVGEGFYEPLDDLGPDRPCSAPRTIEYLGSQFEAHNYDIKWLYRTIMLTQAYQRESRPRRNPEQTPFLANCNQRLRSDQIYSCVANALGLRFEPRSDAMGPGGRKGFGGPRPAFTLAFGYDPSDPRQEVTGTIPQALLLMNSPSLSRVLQARARASELGQLLATESDDEAVVLELYLRCLARQPSEAEVKVCLEHVRTSPSRAEAFEDLAWSLVNTTEFLYRP